MEAWMDKTVVDGDYVIIKLVLANVFLAIQVQHVKSFRNFRKFCAITIAFCQQTRITCYNQQALMKAEQLQRNPKQTNYNLSFVFKTLALLR